jgi:hypothetical protein
VPERQEEDGSIILYSLSGGVSSSVWFGRADGNGLMFRLILGLPVDDDLMVVCRRAPSRKAAHSGFLHRWLASRGSPQCWHTMISSDRMMSR